MIRYIKNRIFTVGIFSILLLASCVEVIPEVEVVDPTSDVYINTLHSGTNTDLEDVYFFNVSEGVVVGGAEYLTTSDGGLNWKTSIPYETGDIKKKVRFKKVTFVNESKGVLTGDIGEEYERRGRLRFRTTGNVILKTDDRGETWSEVKFSDVKAIIKTHAFFNESTGLLSVIKDEDGQVYKTIDGGLTWKLVLSDVKAYGHHGDRDPSKGIADIVYVTENKVVCVGTQGNVYLSLDAGDTWSKDSTAPENRAFKRITFFNESEGYIVGGGDSYPNEDKAMVFKLTLNSDGTTTYEDKTDTYHSVFYFNGLYASQAGDLWACGHLGQVFATYDQGNTWSNELTKTKRESDLLDLDFPTDKIGYFVGDGGIILKVNLAE